MSSPRDLVVPGVARLSAVRFLAISVGTHALLYRRWPTKLVLGTTGSKGFSTVSWGVIVADQALHLSILAISMYWLPPSPA